LVTYRVLVVEDHERWRQYISSALQNTPQWRVIGEVSDGAEAVQQARALSPDLILLDIGLPTLNGIQAARQMIAERPGSRIVFVSEHQSWEIVGAAMATGARGYVIKSNILSDLLRAMNAVIDGRRFISAALGGRVVDPTSDGRATQDARRHEVGFYEDESSRLDGYTRFAEAAHRRQQPDRAGPGRTTREAPSAIASGRRGHRGGHQGRQVLSARSHIHVAIHGRWHA